MHNCQPKLKVYEGIFGRSRCGSTALNLTQFSPQRGRGSWLSDMLDCNRMTFWWFLLIFSIDEDRRIKMRRVLKPQDLSQWQNNEIQEWHWRTLLSAADQLRSTCFVKGPRAIGRPEVHRDEVLSIKCMILAVLQLISWSVVCFAPNLYKIQYKPQMCIWF